MDILIRLILVAGILQSLFLYLVFVQPVFLLAYFGIPVFFLWRRERRKKELPHEKGWSSKG